MPRASTSKSITEDGGGTNSEPARKKPRSTAFPLSRIKKIMQMDDDVGKVANSTPVGVSKALELFLKDLVEHCSAEASKLRTRKISPSHLRAAVMNTEHFDFLKDIVENIPEDHTIHNSDEEEEEDGKKKRVRKKKEDGENGPKKRAPKGEGKKGGRKKKDDQEAPASVPQIQMPPPQMEEEEETEDEEMYSE